MARAKWVFILLVMGLLGGPAAEIGSNANERTRPPAIRAPAHLFDRSTRRSPHKSELRALVQLASGRNSKNAELGCAAFFVKNQRNRFFIGSARHCLSFQTQKACHSGQLMVRTASGGHWGRCSRIVAESKADDFFIFEAEMENGETRVLESIDFLELTPIDFEAGIPLQAIGFPIDSERDGQPTVSESCAITSDSLQPYWEVEPKTISPSTRRTSTLQREQKIPPEESSSPAMTRDEALALIAIQREAVIYPHNCSVYGGNSGGPMVIAGTNQVVGLPFSYADTEDVYPSDSAFGLMETVIGLTSRMEAVMKREGIVTTQTEATEQSERSNRR